MSSARSAAPLPSLKVGGQAVLEGVMMRSPRSFVVVCRRPDQSIVLTERPWISAWDRLRLLRWPLLRGGVVFWETLQNGLQALSFSAQQQATEEDAAGAGSGSGGGGTVSSGAITGTIIFSLALAFLIFAALPHLLTFVTGQLTGTPLDGKSFAFHAVDGAFKLLILVGYLFGVSRLKEIQRVFGYHGAEHKAIFTFEAGEPLTVENARKYTTFHPRCGTSFLLLVILISILVFTLAFSGPWMPVFFENRWLNQLAYVLIKLPLMFPIAGIAYEFLKLSGKYPSSPLLRPLIAPGLWLQRITTRPPTDEMLEVALLSLRKVLWREAQLAEAEALLPGAAAGGGKNGGRVAPVVPAEPEIYQSLAEVDLPLFGRAADAALPGTLTLQP